MTKQPPAGLKRYIEWLPLGKRTGRVAYIVRESNLPEPVRGGEWELDAKFNVADELLSDPALKYVLKAAIDKGCATVSAPTPSVLDSRD